MLSSYHGEKAVIGGFFMSGNEPKIIIVEGDNEEYEKNTRTIFLLQLIQKKAGVLQYEIKNEEFMAFDSKEECEIWLGKKGFVYGQELCCKYIAGNDYWFHQNKSYKTKVYAYIHEEKIKNSNSPSPDWLSVLIKW